MKQPKLCLVLAFAAIAAMQFVTPKSARADTYQIVGINIDNASFYGLASTGQVVLDTYNPYCGNASPCYGHDGAWSGAVPTLSFDNGTPCSPSLPQGTSDLAAVCSNGRDAFYGYESGNSGPDGLYSFTGSNTPQLIYTGFLTGSLHMNSVGDIVFDDGGLDEWYEAIDLTNSVAPTPEPSTLLLLATGILGAGFIVRRRRIAYPPSLPLT